MVFSKIIIIKEENGYQLNPFENNLTGGRIMAMNFRISRHRSNNVLDLSLRGDFDGSSAMELLKVLEDSKTSVSRIIIHTNGLRNIHPFGKGVFQKDFPKINRSPVNVIFKGDKGDLSR